MRLGNHLINLRLEIVVILHVEGRGAHVTCLIAALQPTLALVGGAVGERLGRGTALSLLLEPVVADGLGEFETFLQVAVLHRVVHLVLIVGPDTGVVVGEQLEADADLVGIHLVGLVHLGVGLREGSREVFDVVADLASHRGQS